MPRILGLEPRRAKVVPKIKTRSRRDSFEDPESGVELRRKPKGLRRAVDVLKTLSQDSATSASLAQGIASLSGPLPSLSSDLFSYEELASFDRRLGESQDSLFLLSLLQVELRAFIDKKASAFENLAWVFEEHSAIAATLLLRTDEAALALNGSVQTTTPSAMARAKARPKITDGRREVDRKAAE